MSSLNDVSFSSLMTLPPLQPSKKRRRIIPSPDNLDASNIIDIRTKPSKSLSLNSPPITIVVGPDNTEDNSDQQETFYVHEDAICAASPFFANAMKPEWAALRPDPRTITLPDDDPAAFSLYMSYLYAKQLPILPESSDSSQDSPEGKYRDADDGYTTLAYAYVLGERLMDAAFKNAIIDAYVLYARGYPVKRCYPTNQTIRILYEGTHAESPIRRFLVDIWTARGKWEWLESDPDLPKEFLVQVTKGLLKGRQTGEGARPEALSRPWKLTHEQYYEE